MNFHFNKFMLAKQHKTSNINTKLTNMSDALRSKYEKHLTEYVHNMNPNFYIRKIKT